MTVASGSTSDVCFVGGGAIGLSAAWQAARCGLSVTVFDPDPGHGAAWAAAGMLAPVTEVHYGEEELLALNLAAAKRWPSFAQELEGDCGRSVGYRDCGTLLVAGEEGDRPPISDLFEFQQQLGLEVSWLTASQARRLEPGLSPAIRGALWAPNDHQVDNRLVVSALIEAAGAAGVTIRRETVVSIEHDGSCVGGVVLDSQRDFHSQHVVLCAGCRSSEIGGLPAGIVPPVRPVKGQILRLAPAPAQVAAPRLLSHTVRGMVNGSFVYMVPRGDGSIVVGATSEERGYDASVTAGAVYELLRDAHRLVPGITEMALVDTMAGLRPGSPDNGPIVGPSAIDGLILATGHHRNGILLAPITADAVVALLQSKDMPTPMQPFGPARFRALQGSGRPAATPATTVRG